MLMSGNSADICISPDALLYFRAGFGLRRNLEVVWD